MSCSKTVYNFTEVLMSVIINIKVCLLTIMLKLQSYKYLLLRQNTIISHIALEATMNIITCYIFFREEFNNMLFHWTRGMCQHHLVFYWQRIYFSDYTIITNLMHWLLFIRKILLSSTCFEHQVLVFRRT